MEINGIEITPEFYRHEWAITPGNRYFPDVLNTQTGFVMRPYRIVTERTGNVLSLVEVTGYRIRDGAMDTEQSDVWKWTSDSDFPIPWDLHEIVR